MGPRRAMPGWISASGLAVSTVDETIAMNQFFVDTCERTFESSLMIENQGIIIYHRNDVETVLV